jgi:energy-coupling factor transporter ATP-binding protein EcfA2
MILRPRLLLLDEPLADMDDAGAELLAQAIEELQDSTILIASPTGQSQMLAARDYHLSPARST